MNWLALVDKLLLWSERRRTRRHLARMRKAKVVFGQPRSGWRR